MNRRIRRPSATKPDPNFLRYLKPGALALLRDSRISARSHRLDLQPQISLHCTSTASPPSSPVRLPNVGQAQQIGPMDAMPCFAGRVYGPRCPQRKKLLAAKSVFFLSSTPATPVPDAPDNVIDVFNTNSDILVAH